MNPRRLRGAVFAWWVLAVAGSAAADADLAQQGRRLYRDGVLASGEPLRATTVGGGTLVGAPAACASCHRRSGFGSSEGGRLVPPVAADILFHPRADLEAGTRAAAPGAGGTRPAYDDEALRRALRDGVDPAGRALKDPMPRYNLDRADMRALAAYLHELSTRDAEGVSDTTMHFATIVTDGVSDIERRSLLGVLQGFVADHNAEIRRETRRGEGAVFGHSRAYRAWRRWELHLWPLHGPSHTWGAQLERHYRAAPVFAVISGAGRGSWRPVHEFCERRELPCLFPSTDLPEAADTDFYSFYLSRGIELEALVLAQRLREAAATRGVVQIYREGREGAMAAARLRRLLENVPGVAVTDRHFGNGETPASGWQRALGEAPGDVTVLWLDTGDLAALPVVPPGEIFLSSSLADFPAREIPAALRSRAQLIHPFELPGAWETKRAPLARFLKKHGLTTGDERTQANAYLAFNLVGRALKHFRERYSREYLIERIEHIADNSPWTSVYPYIGLGVGQRFASKGGYVIRLAADGTVAGASDWIVPSP